MGKNTKIAQQLADGPYVVRIIVDTEIPDEPLYVAENPELVGCMAQGTTLKEAEEELKTFRAEYIEHLLDNNLPVPPPSYGDVMSFGGSFKITNVTVLEDSSSISSEHDQVQFELKTSA